MQPLAIPTTYHHVIDLRRSELIEKLTSLLPPGSAGSVEFVLEVGCGHGHFLTAFATAHPERLCLGIDLVSERIERANRKQQRAGLTNLHFLRADARLFLEALPAHARISDVFILFPDPWPKARHHKHRIMQSAFLAELATHATVGARLCFRTDYDPYFDDAVQVIGGHPDWRIGGAAWPFEYETVFQSRATSYRSLVAGRQEVRRA